MNVGKGEITGDNLSFTVEGVWVTRPILGIDQGITAKTRSIMNLGLGIKIYLGISLDEKTPPSELGGVSQLPLFMQLQPELGYWQLPEHAR